MSDLLAKNRNGIRRSFSSASIAAAVSTQARAGRASERASERASVPPGPATRAAGGWGGTGVRQHVVQLLLRYAYPQLVLAVHHVDHGVALAVIRRPQVAVRACSRHVEHRERDVVLRELLHLEADRRHDLRVLVLWSGGRCGPVSDAGLRLATRGELQHWQWGRGRAPSSA